MLARAFAASLGVLSLVFGAAFLSASLAERGALPEQNEVPAASAPEALSDGVHFAGSGSTLIVTRALVDGFREEHPEARFFVHDSIGSTGGVRAVADGAIQVGLASRPLNHRERGLGLEQLVFARTPIALIAHPGVTDAQLTSDDVAHIFSGERNRWSDGRALVVILRERGDSGQTILSRFSPQIGEALESALDEERFRVQYHDDDLINAVMRIEGAFGVSDLSRVLADAPSARVFALNGVTPTLEHVEDGTYPLAKELSFVLARPIPPSLEQFIAFVRSERGREIVRSRNCEPLLRHGETP